jgi:hypothetical protein
MKKWICIGALFLSACRPEVSDGSCDQASFAAWGAIDKAAGCSDAISSSLDSQSAESLANCILLHQQAIERTQATEHACAGQIDVVRNIREARGNLERTSNLLDSRLGDMKGRN